jgi:hypothetical protein
MHQPTLEAKFDAGNTLHVNLLHVHHCTATYLLALFNPGLEGVRSPVLE